MNIALIIAGGIGKRTGQSVPKQYLTINDIPVIVYTMRNIQNSGLYNKIYVVCSDGWKDFIISYATQYGIDTFEGTIRSGETRFDSYYNGIKYLFENGYINDFVSVIDANRPLIPFEVLKDNLSKLSDSNLVVTTDYCYDTMYMINDNNTLTETLDRKHLCNGQTPESAKVCFAYKICQNAVNDKIYDQPLAALMIKYGEKVICSKGSSKCFKITTADDISILKALISTSENIL